MRSSENYVSMPVMDVALDGEQVLRKRGALL
jgi:hypothetical protein